MKIKYLLVFYIILVLLLPACANQPDLQVRRPVSALGGTEREFSAPDVAVLRILEQAANKVISIRNRIIEVNFPSIFPEDWEIANNLFLRAERALNTTTLRETEESIARYNIAAQVFEALDMKVIAIYEGSGNGRIAIPDNINPEYIITNGINGEAQEDYIVIAQALPAPSPHSRTGLAAAAAARREAAAAVVPVIPEVIIAMDTPFTTIPATIIPVPVIPAPVVPEITVPADLVVTTEPAEVIIPVQEVPEVVVIIDSIPEPVVPAIAVTPDTVAPMHAAPDITSEDALRRFFTSRRILMYLLLAVIPTGTVLFINHRRKKIR
jgi:hypothetical protein